VSAFVYESLSPYPSICALITVTRIGGTAPPGRSARGWRTVLSRHPLITLVASCMMAGGGEQILEKQMARALKAKKLAQIGANREGSIYRLHVEDEADKKTLFELTSDQALLLADTLDKLLADEEEEQRPRPSAPHEAASVRRERLGTVKWYNVTKGFGFVTPDGGGGELFLHRSVLEQAGMTDLAEGTRVCFQTVEGKKPSGQHGGARVNSGRSLARASRGQGRRLRASSG